MGVDLYMMGDIPSFVHVAFPNYDLKHLKKAIAYYRLASEQLNPNKAYHFYGRVRRHEHRSNVPFPFHNADWVWLGRNSDTFNSMVERDDPEHESDYWNDKYEGYHFRDRFVALSTWSIQCRWNVPNYLLKEASQHITDLYIA